MYISRARQKKGWFFCFCFLAIARLERSPFVCQFMYFPYFFCSHSNRFCFFFHSIVSGRLSGTFSTVDVYTMSFFSRMTRFIYSISSSRSNQICCLLNVQYEMFGCCCCCCYRPVSRTCASQSEPNRIKPNQNS